MIFGLKCPEKWLLAIFGEFSNEVGWQMNDRTVEIPDLGPISVENLIFRWIFENWENPIILSKNANFSLFYPISPKDFVKNQQKHPETYFQAIVGLKTLIFYEVRHVAISHIYVQTDHSNTI